MGNKTRCLWAKTDLYIAYHDTEWGVPVHDDRTLFEFLILEGAQAGLSWETILRKRDAYRQAFDGFDPELVACYGAKKVRALLANEGIIRNRAKIKAAVGNAKEFKKIQSEFGTFDAYLWEFVGGKPTQNKWKSHQDVPAATSESETLSKDLHKRGLRFVGPTICYAFMQAVGMVNDHVIDSFRHKELASPKKRQMIRIGAASNSRFTPTDRFARKD
ncbi:MAG: DNA-3-methyladenine glycosylase I [Planctomycetes bacterium]|nr:DNA-3-methyladenine glycosylase I [Planctomycetota bacterium]